MPALEDLTIREAREIAALFGSNGAKVAPSHSFVVGMPVFIRSVTHYYTGRIAVVTDSDIGLDEAAWIACTGRFSDALKGIDKAESSEIEPFPGRVFVARGAIVDWCEYKPALPSSQK